MISPAFSFVTGSSLARPFTELRQPNRHDRTGVEADVHQVLDAAAQMLAVVPAGTDDDLAVHLDAGLAEGAHILQALIGVFVAQQRAPELRLGRLHGDVDGADAQVDDALAPRAR